MASEVTENYENIKLIFDKVQFKKITENVREFYVGKYSDFIFLKISICNNKSLFYHNF